MQINPEEAVKVVKGYIEKVDMLLKLSYMEGTDQKDELDTSIRNFTRTTFPDGEAKLEEYRPRGIVSIGEEQTEQEKQEEYVSTLKKMRHHLVAFSDELKLKVATFEKAGQLDKIGEKTKALAAEAKRREAVAESKAYGALIEIIDKLRDELKRKSERDRDIIEIKKDIKDLKSMVLKLIESPFNKS